MKTILKKVFTIDRLIAIILLLALLITIQIIPKEFTLEYLDEGEIRREVFYSVKEFNDRANELESEGIKYYLLHQQQ